MSKVHPDNASQVHTAEGFEGRFEELDEYTVAFESCTVDMDSAALFVGLPDDACQCPHWGIVLEGRMVFRYTDGTTEEVGAGEAYYLRPGHTATTAAGTRLVEFSPTDQLQKTMEVALRNLEAAKGS